MKKLSRGLLRIVLAAGSFIMWILSFQAVRSWLWNKAETKGKEKIVDAKAKVVKNK
ncbi:MAG: hypothetical protein HOI80_02550 [Alphaproteobacteria bacterium]|jgi:hypothetical protein|nr:hypothetical protein [Candidatus Uhrbacteria bacterium]MBT5654365.1 hypothetical protein [Alphaproteobacteria bacterium]